MKIFGFDAMKLLTERLDNNLLDHARDLCAGDGLQILDVYRLQGLTEVHCYLKTVHEFNAAEVDALLQFADPLEVAQDCWENNTHEYSFPICELLEATQARERFPLAAPTPSPEKPSVRDRLRTAIQETTRQASSHGHNRSGEPR